MQSNKNTGNILRNHHKLEYTPPTETCQPSQTRSNTYLPATAGKYDRI